MQKKEIKNKQRKKIRKIKLDEIEQVIEFMDETPTRTNQAFNLLLDIYESMDINWRAKYKYITLGKSSEDKWEKYIKERIMDKPPKNLKEIKEKPIINRNKDKEIVNLARVILLANKAAHSYISEAEKLLKKQGIEIERKEIKKLYLYKDEDRYKQTLQQIDESNREKIEMIEGTNLEKMIKDLIKGNTKLYEIKNTSIELLLERLDEIDNAKEKYSYGYKIDDRENKRLRSTFIFDIPGYGQLSVHLVQPWMKRKLPKYEYPLYIKDNLMFFKGLSEDARDFLELDDKRTTKGYIMKMLKESELGDEYTHFFAVKLMGDSEKIKLTPSDLREIERVFKRKRDKEFKENLEVSDMPDMNIRERIKVDVTQNNKEQKHSNEPKNINHQNQTNNKTTELKKHYKYKIKKNQSNYQENYHDQNKDKRNYNNQNKRNYYNNNKKNKNPYKRKIRTYYKKQEQNTRKNTQNYRKSEERDR